MRHAQPQLIANRRTAEVQSRPVGGDHHLDNYLYPKAHSNSKKDAEKRVVSILESFGIEDAKGIVEGALFTIRLDKQKQDLKKALLGKWQREEGTNILKSLEVESLTVGVECFGGSALLMDVFVEHAKKAFDQYQPQ